MQHEDDESKLLAVKGHYGFWGSIIFHVSILLIVIGGLLTAVGSFLAGIVVTEGQTLPLVRENLVDVARLPRSGFNQPGLSVRLDTFAPTLVDETAVKYIAQMTISDDKGNETSKAAGINDALTFEGYRFMIENYGFAPWLEVTDNSSGKVLIDSFINLMGRGPDQPDNIGLPGSAVSFQTFIYPEFEQQGNKAGTKSVLPNNPVYKLVSSTGKEGLLPLHQELKLDNYTIRFKDLRYWTSFKVASDPGEGPLFLGLILACIGTAVRFIDPRKIIRIELESLEGGKVCLRAGGYHSYFPDLFKSEVKEMLEKIVVR